MSTKEGQLFEAVIKDIKPLSSLGGEGGLPIAIVNKIEGLEEAWYPLEDNHGFIPGERVIIMPQIDEHPSGGSITTYRIDHLIKI